MRLVAPLLALFPLAAVAAACGGSSASDPVAKAAAASAKAQAEHMHIDSKVTANGATVSVTGDGDFANDPLLGSLISTVTVGSNVVPLRGIERGSVVYVSSPTFKGQLPAGKTWMSVDYGKVAQSQGVSLTSLASQSPADALKQLEAGGKTTKVGEETVGGVHTTHYRTTIDGAKAAKLSGLTHAKLSYQPADVWIDDQGRVRKEHVAYTAAQTASTPQVSTDLTATFSDYGEKVHVLVPSASVTYDATALAMQQATTTTGGTP